MRRLTAIVIVPLALACSRADTPPADTTAAGGTVTPGALTAADIQGRWNVRAMPETGDSTLVTYVVNATGDPSTWTVELPNRPPQPVTVTIAGDSVVMVSGNFESVLRPGVQVQTTTVGRIRDGRLVGTTVARYPQAAGADTIRTLRIEGTRAN